MENEKEGAKEINGEDCDNEKVKKSQAQKVDGAVEDLIVQLLLAGPLELAGGLVCKNR